MGFDSRHLVLEFLADNRNLGIQQMTLVFFGKKSDPFLQQCLNTLIDKVFVYHNKGTRLFWKEYDYDKLSGSIIELLFDTNTSLNISKKEINFEVCEPYYFLDLQKFDFNYLSVIAVKEAEELIGYALLYGDKEIKEEEYPLVSLRRLYRNIVKNENHAKFLEFDQILKNNYGFLKFENNVYLSEALSDFLKIDQQYTKTYEELFNLLLKNDFQEVEIKKQDNYEVHFLKLNQKILNSIDEINNQIYDEFTLFYLEYKEKNELTTLSLVEKIKEKLIIVFPNDNYSMYKVSDTSIVVLYYSKKLKKDINSLNNKLKEFHIIDIRSVVDVPKKVDLVKISKYLHIKHIKNFDYQTYQQYRMNESTNLYFNDVKNKQIINSISDKQLGIFYENASFNIDNLDSKQYNCFKVQLDKIDEQFIENLKECVKNNKIILVCSVNSQEVDFCREYLNKLKKIGVYLFVDSSVFMNLDYWELLKLVKGIFIEEEEINKLDDDKINLIIDMHLKQSKLVFINNNCIDKNIITSKNIYKII